MCTKTRQAWNCTVLSMRSPPIAILDHGLVHPDQVPKAANSQITLGTGRAVCSPERLAKKPSFLKYHIHYVITLTSYARRNPGLITCMQPHCRLVYGNGVV